MSGKTLLASSLLGVATRTAQRMGIHRDGTYYNLSAWQIEVRRRLWHQIVLLDTWCMEQHGFESAVSQGLWDTKLPLNADDAAWNVSEFASREPPAQNGFTDNSFALVQYEIAALIRLGLDPGVSSDVFGTGLSPAHDSGLQEAFWDFMEDTYLARLDGSQAQQRLVSDVAGLTKKRIALMNARISIADGHDDQNFQLGDDCG